MTKEVYSIYDSKCEFYTQPFMVRAKGEAIRAFSDLANDDKTQVGQHPEDFTLFQLATFDENTGKYESLLTPKSICLANEMKKLSDGARSNL